MKKLVLYLSLFTILAALTCGCMKHDDGYDVQTEQYFGKINEILKDLDFNTAEAKDCKIILYNKEREIISEIPFAEYDKSKKFIYAYKRGANVYFVTYGAVDDEWGVMFVNDESNRMMDGIKRAERIGGNSYEYSTMK